MGGSSSIERELKVEVPAEFVVPGLDGFEASGAGSTVHLHAVYWDTAELALAAWGHTLRSRRSDDGDERGWTLKLAAGSGSVATRREVDFPDETETPPAAALDIVRGIIGHQSVAPIATIDTRRCRVQLRHVASGTGVELDDDLVTSTVAGAMGPSFREIEVELLDDDPSVLVPAADALRAAGAGRPDPTPKLLRVLGGRGPARPLGDVDRRPRTGAELVGAAIAGATRQLLANDPVIRLDGDPEAVHQARVATRRLRADLKTLGALLDPFRVAGLRRELAWLGAVLGHVRDRDVLATTLTRRADRLETVDRAAIDQLVAHLHRERTVHFGVLLDVLRSSRYLGLVADLTRLAAEPPLRRGATADDAAQHAARKLAGAAYRRLERKIDRLPRTPGTTELHEVRKAAKQARYAAELVAPVAKGKTDRLARRLAKLQDHLGDKQDDATLTAWLLALPFDELGGAAAFTAGRLAQETTRAAAETHTDWHPAWYAARAAHHRSWLG